MTDRTKTVVVTGSTRGIGFGMATALLGMGCRVVITARAQAGVDEAAAQLAKEHGADRILGLACDVASPRDVQALWDAAAARFGRVDVWINNAGTSNPQRAFVEQTTECITAVVGANLLGTMLGSRVALAGMTKQGSGQLYNMEGYGSDGSMQPGMALYGSTKRAVRYFTRALAREARGTPIQVCTLSPGIVVTDLLVSVYQAGDPENWRRSRRLFNIIADRVETVAPWLAREVLENRRSGAHIAWMTIPKAMTRFLRLSYLRRDLFAGLDR